MKPVPILFLVAGIALGVAGPAAAEEAARTFEVRAVRDIAYIEGNGADPVRNKLDLYLPRDHADFPVVMFVHGGAWRTGDKHFFGIYPAFAAMLARHGIGAAVINYRLSPQVQHPGHIRDVARAFAWMVQNVGKHGGRADQLFLCGHSAGGHLISLLATDESYLKAVDLDLRAIRGVMPISGAFRIPPDILPSVFGTDREVRRQASPLTHVRPDAPPFLILYAEKDFPTFGDVAEEFCRALQSKKCEAYVREVKDRNHKTIIVNAVVDSDPVAQAIRGFIRNHCTDDQER